MPTFVGFNTINQYKRYTLVDFDLIKRDVLNSLSIRQGEVPGRPMVGTSVWNFIFDNQSTETVRQIEAEMRRVVGLDPRVSITDLTVYTQDNVIVVEMALRVVGSTEAERLAVFFNPESNRASFV